MPGYRLLPDTVGGETADRTRTGAQLEQEGDHEGALREYELALGEALLSNPVVPGFLCGRLAALYRRLERYDDEVQLLELYQASQVSDKARTRFDARLSKARAIAAKQAKRDSGALASIRDIKRRNSIRRGRLPKEAPADQPPPLAATEPGGQSPRGDTRGHPGPT